MLRSAVYIGAIALGISVYFGVTGLYVEKGVRKEQVRVQAAGEQVAKKIDRAQRDSARKPAPSVLDKWSID